jgi:outer membrane biosynthesis protein TonB
MSHSQEGPTREPDLPPNLSFPSSRRRYFGLAVSLVLHAALLGVIVFQGDRLWTRTLAPGAPSLFLVPGGGGGGGNRVAYITLPSSPRPEPQPPTPVPPPETPPEAVPPPVEETEVVQPVPRPVDTLPAVASAETGLAASASGTGPGAAGGAGGGTGPGVGPGSGEGRGPGAGGGGGVIRPPELRDLAFPFETPPKELRGASLDVVFWVRVDGRVERYEVRPAITDRDYARKFDEVIRAFRFTPARAPDGSRIAGTTRVTFTLPGKRSS